MKGIGLGLVLVASCTTSSPGDVVPDPTGPLSVVVTRNHAPIAGATVVFGDPAGNVVAVATSDAAGAASTDLAVSQVTVVDPDQTTRLLTVAHVQPGDPLELPLEAVPNPVGPTIAMLTVQPPPGAAPARTDHYELHTGCGSFSPTTLPATVAVSASCIGTSGRVPVVIEAASASTSLESPAIPLAFAAGLASSSGADYAFAAPSWSTACVGVDISNPKPMQLSLWQRFDGLDFRDVVAGFCYPTASSGYDYAYPVLQLDDGVTAFAFGEVTGALGMTLKTTSFATMPAAVAIEHDPDLLVGDVGVQTITTHGITYARSSELAVADIVLAQLSFSRGSQTFVEWRLVEPSWATAASLPSLPPSIDYGLDASTQQFGELHFIDATWIDDLGAGQRALALLLDPTARDARLPADTSVREYHQTFP
jgi:hypothetical protein